MSSLQIGFAAMLEQMAGRNQREWIDVFGRDVLPRLAR